MKFVATIIERLARAAAFALTATSPERARRFGLWYRTLPVLYPRWFVPLRWVKPVAIPGGSLMFAPFSEVLGMSLIVDGVWQKAVTQRLLSLLKPGDVFIDVGANMGYFTLLASSRVGSNGLVVAFEPEIGNLARLASNVAASACRNVIVLSEAAGDTVGNCQITTPPEYNTGVASLRTDNTGSGRFNLAAVRTLDDALRHVGDISGRSIVVKIDAEGFEPQVVAGMAALMREAGQLSIICELSPQWCNISDVVKAFDEAGLCGEAIIDGKWQVLDAKRLPARQTDAIFIRTAA